MKGFRILVVVAAFSCFFPLGGWAAGTAHAWDLIQLPALAIEKAGAIDRPSVRNALEHLDVYSGLVRVYRPPFTPDRHDALNREDFRLARYGRKGAIVPLSAIPGKDSP